MITFVFLAFVVACAVAGIVIAVMAKKRPDGKAERPMPAVRHDASVGRASGGDD